MKSLCAACTGVILLSYPMFAAGAVPIEGDAALLEAVRAGIATTRSQLMRGSAHLIVSFDASVDFRSEGDLIWDNGRCYYRHTHTKSPSQSIPLELQSREPLLEEAIITPQWSFVHHPERQQAGRYGRDKFASLPLRRQWNPQETWFRFGIIDIFHEDILNPDDPRKVERVEKIEIRPEAEGRVFIAIVFRSGGGTEYRASLKHGGNIVEFRTVPAPRALEGDIDEDLLVQEGKYRWQQHASGVWCLAEADFANVYPFQPERRGMQYRIEVSDFNPEVTWKPDRFEFDSLDIKPGTGIIEITNTGNKSWRHKTAPGDRAPTQQSLDNLGDRLKKQGFSAPQEK